jgi:hypothetical protein
LEEHVAFIFRFEEKAKQKASVGREFVFYSEMFFRQHIDYLFSHAKTCWPNAD